MPTPNKGEKEQAFISRCIGDAEAVKTFPDQKQREAFCYSTWAKHSGKATAAETMFAESVPADLAERMAVIFAEVNPLTGTLKNVEIFKVGTWKGSKKVEATSAMLDQIVSNFNELNSKVSGYGVPVKLGHSNDVGSPAYGWMSDLCRVGDTLVADFSDMDPAIVDAIGKRRYNSVSVELYPSIDFGGKTFNNVLGGIALLGAEWPAVKGLKPLSASMFAGATADKLVLSEEEMTTFTQEQHDAIVAAAVAKGVADAGTLLTAEQAKTTAAEQRAVRAETALAALHEEHEKAALNAVIEAAEKDGKIVPANKPKVLAFADAVRSGIKSSEDRGKALTMLKEFVDGLPKRVTFGEKGRSEQDVNGGAKGQKIADQIDAEARAFMSSDPKMTYEMAVARVYREKPDLKTAYAQEM